MLLATDLPWPVSRAWCQVQFEHERLGRDAYRIRFYQLRGSMRRYEGSVLIEPWQRWKGGGTSTVTYELVAVPDSSAPKSWINRQVRDAAVKWVHYLRQRINALRYAGRLHPTQPADPHLDSPLDGRQRLTPVTEVAKAR